MKTEFDPSNYSQNYLAHIQETQSENTYQAKRTTIRKFVEYCNENKVTIDIEDQYGTADDIYQFFEDDWLKPIKTYLYHIRDFLDYIGDQHDTEVYYRFEDLKDKLKNKRLPNHKKTQGQFDPEWLSDEEIEAACEATDDEGELIIRILFDTGARRAEVAAWTPDDVNWTPGIEGLGASVSIDKKVTKTGGVENFPKTELGYRNVELSPETAQMLREYIEANNLDSTDSIFNNNASLLYRKVKEGFCGAGIHTYDDGEKTKVAPHWLRYARNTRLRQNPNISEADREQYIGNDMPRHYTEVDKENVQGVLTR